VLFCFSLVLCAPLSRGAAEGWGVKTSHDSGKGVVTREQILINPPVLRTSPFEKGEHSWNIAFPLCFALHFQGELPKAEGLKNITNWQRGYNKRTDIDKFPLSCGHPPLKRGSIVCTIACINFPLYLFKNSYSYTFSAILSPSTFKQLLNAPINSIYFISSLFTFIFPFSFLPWKYSLIS